MKIKKVVKKSGEERLVNTILQAGDSCVWNKDTGTLTFRRKREAICTDVGDDKFLLKPDLVNFDQCFSVLHLVACAVGLDLKVLSHKENKSVFGFTK